MAEDERGGSHWVAASRDLSRRKWRPQKRACGKLPKGLSAPMPIFHSGTSFSLLGNDLGRPLVDSLIEN